MDARGAVVAAVKQAASAAECWQLAEWHLLDEAFRDRLGEIGITPTADSAVTLMAAAVFLAEQTAEFGGDARDALGEVAMLGLRLLGEPEVGVEPTT